MKRLALILVALVLAAETFCLHNLAAKVKNQEHEVQVVEVYTPVIVEYFPETETTESTEETKPTIVTYNVPLTAELQRHIVLESEEKGIDPTIIFAMAKRESNYRANAVGDGGESFGLLQIQAKWHWERMEELGCTNLLDPFQNVTVGVDYLAELLERYGDIGKALTAYNRGSYKGTVTEYAQDIITMASKLEATINVVQN
jgi:soluble lytic murein transglycosylase-like protein